MRSHAVVSGQERALASISISTERKCLVQRPSESVGKCIGTPCTVGTSRQESVFQSGSVQPGIPTSQVGGTFQRQGVRTHSKFCDCWGRSRISTRIVVRARSDELVPRSFRLPISQWEFFHNTKHPNLRRSFPDAFSQCSKGALCS